MPFRVGITYNLRGELPLKPGDPPDLNAEFDREETIDHIERALRESGHSVVRIGNARRLLERAKELDVDIVFNIAEGYGGRNRESQVPILLELLGIPFVGADGLSLGLTLDKVLTKKVLFAEGIPSPRYVEMGDPAKLRQVDLTYPLIVKLRYEGSSKGLSEKSLVTTPEELRRQVDWLLQAYKGAAVFIEEFIEGTEFTVAVTGNETLEAHPVCQIVLDGQRELGRQVFNFAYLRGDLAYLCPAPIPDVLAKQMQELALRTYRAVECRDFGRVDFRVDRRGKPYVLEINPLPCLSADDVFNYIAKAKGITHYQMINRILDAALERYGFMPRSDAGSSCAAGSH